MELLLLIIVLALFLVREKIQIYKADKYAERMAEIRRNNKK